MRRQTVAIACAFAIFSLAACDSSSKQTQPAPQPAPLAANASVCDRIRAHLTTPWTTAKGATRALIPLADNCHLIDSKDSHHIIRVSVSAVPVSGPEAIQIRKRRASQLLSGTKYVEAAFGPDSWAFKPSIGAPSLTFRSSGRLINVQQQDDFLGNFAELETVAQTIVALPGGIPPTPAVIETRDCAPGTAAAARALGTKVTMERGGVAEGYAYCAWGSATATVFLRAGEAGSDPAIDAMYEYGTVVNVGDGGHQYPEGLVDFRVGKFYVDVYSTTKGSDPAVLELGRAMVPTFRR